MTTHIFNREEFKHPVDGFYQIETLGEHPNKAAGVVQVIDKAAAETIVNRFNALADKPGFAGMLIDHEHFKHDSDKETTAYGWLMRLENRADGIYGKIRWTSTGQPAVDGGSYRYFSTEYDPADLKVLSVGPPRRVRPMRLDGLTLTNMNNNQGQKPITNRRGEGGNVALDEQQRIAVVASNTLLFQRVMNRDSANGPTTARKQPMTVQKATQVFCERVNILMDGEGLAQASAQARVGRECPELIPFLPQVLQLAAQGKPAVVNRREPSTAAPTTPVGVPIPDCAVLVHDLDYYVKTRNLPSERFLVALTDFRQERGLSYPDAAAVTAQVFPELWAGIPDGDPLKEILSPFVCSPTAPARKIENRAAKLREKSPALSLSTSLILAQREFQKP